MKNERDANRALAERADRRKALALALAGKNRTHKDRKHALKIERPTNAQIWRMIDTGV